MLFKRILLAQWQQFERIEVEFHPELTVITGANGSGKTTLLRFLARHFGWSFHQLRTPQIQQHQSGFRYWINLISAFGRSHRPVGSPELVKVGEISYDDDKSSDIRVQPGADQIFYEPTIDSPQQVPGVFIPSHRREFRYERVQQLPLNMRPWRDDAFSSVRDTMRNSGGQSASYHMKQILVGLAIFGHGSNVVEQDQEARQLYDDFQASLRLILPSDLGFDRLVIRDRAEVVLITKTGDFLLDAVSGGVATLIELAWQVFMYKPPQPGRFVVVIDEPENHLHASMQRSLLPNFTAAFPNAQFVVATHSPLIVGSRRDSNVYVLRFGSNSSVSSEQLDLADKAATADQILRDVLDVPVTMPIWAEQSFEAILAKYAAKELTSEIASELRNELGGAGLTRWIPDALIRVADSKR
jgi:hypothetical protein